MSHAAPSKVIRYSTVQVSENDHIELNSECVVAADGGGYEPSQLTLAFS